MSKCSSPYPQLVVGGSGSGVVSQAGAALLLRTAESVGLITALSRVLSPWRKPLAVHDPGKIVLDLAVAVALGGDCLADIGLARVEPGVFGLVASDPTVSRLITALAEDPRKAVTAIRAARAAARAAAWECAGDHGPDHGIDADDPLIIDLDATLVTAHSDKERAAPNFKHGFGFHPLGAWVDQGVLAVRAERTGDGVTLQLDNGETLAAQEILVANGRRPNTDLLDVAATGVAVDDGGHVIVDEHQRSTVDGVYALGDMSSYHQLKHVANHEARVVQHNLLHPGEPIAADHRFVRHAVFSSPQVASVGLTEEQARERGARHVVSRQEYAGMAYGWAMEDTTGFAKLVADPSTGQLLGARIIGPQASTLIQPVIQAMSFGLDARSMARGQYWIHPAMPELIENALLNLPLD